MCDAVEFEVNAVVHIKIKVS